MFLDDANEKEQVIHGNDHGSIRFGSEVDLPMPLVTEVLVEMNENIEGNRTVMARLNHQQNGTA